MIKLRDMKKDGKVLISLNLKFLPKKIINYVETMGKLILYNI